MIRRSSDYREEYSMDHGCGPASDRFFLWVDAVGGYWTTLSDQVVLGQPDPTRGADVPILGDISPRHACIRRDGENYLIEAFREVRVDGRPVDRVAMLSSKSTIQLGPAVRLLFRRPHALSTTARLDFLSPHRTQPSVDAVLLMADTCVLGPKPHSHVVSRAWPEEVILYRHGRTRGPSLFAGTARRVLAANGACPLFPQEDKLYCRGRGTLEIDGARYENRGPITHRSRIVGDWFSLTLEPIPAPGEKRMGL